VAGLWERLCGVAAGRVWVEGGGEGGGGGVGGRGRFSLFGVCVGGGVA